MGEEVCGGIEDERGLFDLNKRLSPIDCSEFPNSWFLLTKICHPLAYLLFSHEIFEYRTCLHARVLFDFRAQSTVYAVVVAHSRDEFRGIGVPTFSVMALTSSEGDDLAEHNYSLYIDKFLSKFCILLIII